MTNSEREPQQGQLDGMNDNETIDSQKLRMSRHLEVYESYFLLVGDDSQIEKIWREGRQDSETVARYKKIREKFADGYLTEMISRSSSPEVATVFETKLTEPQKEALERVIASVTANSGRALAVYLVAQLAIKAISPEQDVRLHKGSSTRGSKFSWMNGVSLRSIAQDSVGPALSDAKLLRMNQFGAAMTRTFAENYPFTTFYKADIQGAKIDWLGLLAGVESSELDAEAALLYALHLLWKSSEALKMEQSAVLSGLRRRISDEVTLSVTEVTMIISRHIDTSKARARLLEIAMHSLIQAEEDCGIPLDGELKHLMQMRTANLKHGNLGDVELIDGSEVVEAWDAKYGISYLYDALDELVSKLSQQENSGLRFGYVVYPVKQDYQDVSERIQETQGLFGITISVHTLHEWAIERWETTQRAGVEEHVFAASWLKAYVESLAEQRRTRAPIDEPTHAWLQTLQICLNP